VPGESAEILDATDVVADAPGPDIGVHPVSADEVAFPDTRENGEASRVGGAGGCRADTSTVG